MNSFISWIGGKKLLRERIVSMFPTNYEKYVEVFGGAGWVLFHKKEEKEEIYNDMNSNLINLFKIVKYHPDAFIKELEFYLNSRQLFNEIKEDINLKSLTDIQKATRFFVLIKNSYGSKMGTFSADKKDMIKAIDYIKEISQRLNKVIIENLDFEKILNKYDKESTLFYLDPPYFKAENYYKDIAFNEQDHLRLKEALSSIKGKWILSYNDCDYIRDLYKDYNIQEIERQNNLKAKYENNPRYKELIIKNY